MHTELISFINADEPVAIRLGLDGLVEGVTHTSAYKKLLMVMAPRMKQPKLAFSVVAILDTKGRNLLHKVIQQHALGGQALLDGCVADPKSQTAIACELQPWRRDCGRCSVGPLPYCATEARLVLTGGDVARDSMSASCPGSL